MGDRLKNLTTNTLLRPRRAKMCQISQDELKMIFTPANKLVISPGATVYRPGVEALEDGAADLARTVRNDALPPIISAFYRPSRLPRGLPIRSGTRR